jgi:RNA polymerase sigma factor (sigma-70 family)
MHRLEFSDSGEPGCHAGDQSVTTTLIVSAKTGDSLAVDTLMRHCLPRLRRWAHGRLPRGARGTLDTGDLVQDAAFRAINRLHAFEQRDGGSIHAYMRRTVINRILDEIRRIGRRPVLVEVDDRVAARSRTPLEIAMEHQCREFFFEALLRLRSRDRRLILARFERDVSLQEIARQFGLKSAETARVAVSRASRRLEHEVKERLAQRRLPAVRSRRRAVC